MVTELCPLAEQRDGLWFDVPSFAKPPPFIVGHWTGGEGGAAKVHRVLEQRELSVQFVLERDGSLVQMASVGGRCAHAGRRGNVGLGVEAVNQGFPNNDGTSPLPYDVVKVHGAKVRAVRYTEAQLAKWVALCEWAATRYGWPRHVPRELRVLTDAEVSRFRGALEHLHLSAKKADGGGHLVGALLGAGWTAVDP